MEILLGIASIIQCFCYAKGALSKHWLVKLAWRVYNKAWNLKCDTTEMTAATNEDWIG